MEHALEQPETRVSDEGANLIKDDPSETARGSAAIAPSVSPAPPPPDDRPGERQPA
jgi:hypothetical protein